MIETVVAPLDADEAFDLLWSFLQLAPSIRARTDDSNRQKPAKAKLAPAGKSRDLLRIEQELSDALTARVEVRVKKRIKRHGRTEEMGEITIQFGSLDELNGLIDRLRAA